MTVKRKGNKKATILEIARRFDRDRLGPADIEAVRRRLVAALGPAGKTSTDYVEGVLKDAGYKIMESDALAAAFSPDYDALFEDILRFSSLVEAEQSIRRLHALYEHFGQAKDRAGLERVHLVALKGKRRALMIARNTKVELAKRTEKEEIANWFTIWLQTPDAFFSWLELRKRAPDFRVKFVS